MDFVLQPWQLYVVILAGWINRQQQEVIEYLRTENQGFKDRIPTSPLYKSHKIEGNTVRISFDGESFVYEGSGEGQD